MKSNNEFNDLITKFCEAMNSCFTEHELETICNSFKIYDDITNKNIIGFTLSDESDENGFRIN